jgi:hypothetical protein
LAHNHTELIPLEAAETGDVKGGSGFPIERRMSIIFRDELEGQKGGGGYIN